MFKQRQREASADTALPTKPTEEGSFLTRRRFNTALLALLGASATPGCNTVNDKDIVLPTDSDARMNPEQQEFLRAFIRRVGDAAMRAFKSNDNKGSEQSLRDSPEGLRDPVGQYLRLFSQMLINAEGVQISPNAPNTLAALRPNGQVHPDAVALAAFIELQRRSVPAALARGPSVLSKGTTKPGQSQQQLFIVPHPTHSPPPPANPVSLYYPDPDERRGEFRQVDQKGQFPPNCRPNGDDVRFADNPQSPFGIAPSLNTEKFYEWIDLVHGSSAHDKNNIIASVDR